MKKIRMICSIIFIFVFMICSSNISIKALENQVLVDGEYLTYKTEEKNDERHIYALNTDGTTVTHLIFKDDVVFEENSTGDLSVIAYIENDEPQENEVQTRAVEPNWGGMISERKRVSFPNPESSTAVAITGIIVGAVFPGASIPYAIAAAIAEYIMNYNQRYVDLTCYYRAAAGCPQYRWYDRYEYRNQSGAVFRTVSLNRKSFIGVANSPQNPPACRMYGF